MRRILKKIIYSVAGIHNKYASLRITVDWNFSDVFIVSYPKSGVSWLALILANILSIKSEANKRIDFFSVHDYIPDLHSNPQRIIHVPPPRIIKTHENFVEWYDRIKISGHGTLFPRVIYLIRDGRDVMASYYNYTKNVTGYSGDFQLFLKNNKVKREHWAKHVKHWLIENKVIDNREILLVKYENIKIDPHTEIEKILSFIGLEIDEQIITKAILNADVINIMDLEKKYGSGVRYHNRDYNFASMDKKRNYNDTIKTYLNKYYEDNKEIFQKFGY